MGTVNVFRGLDTIKETLSFNGVIKENLALNWEYVKIYKGSEELTPDYNVKGDDTILVVEYPEGVTVAILIIGIVSIAVGLGFGIYGYVKAKEIEREMNEALKRIGKTNKQSDVSSIPQLSGGRNEKADGKQSPIIIGRHLFTPYYLSDPYMRPAGEDGEDLYWYAAFVAGQNGLCFEKVRNGATELVTLTGETAQKGKYFFESGAGEAFYDSENFIEIVQKGETSLNTFTEPIFEEKWVDALESTVEIGRKRKEGAKVIDDIWLEDDGPEPVIRESARFPMRLEIELFVDGLHGFDSNNGVETEATIQVKVEWSADNNTWGLLYMNGWDGESLTRAKSKQMRFIATIDLPSTVYSKDGKPVFIRATRMCRMHAGAYRDRVYLSAIRTKQYNPKTSTNFGLVPAKNINPLIVDKFCRLGIKIKANINTEDALDRFNIVACMTGRVFENNQWSANKVKTSNPAAVALEILTGLIHEPSRYTYDNISLQSFAELYQYCSRQEAKIEGEGVQQISLKANGVVTGSARKIDLLKAVLATCEAGLYINEYGKFIVYFDDYQSVPVGLLNPQRIVNMTEQRSLARKIDGYKVEFVNEEADWSNDTHRILRPRVELRPGENTYTAVKLEYTTNYYQAMWLTRRMMAKEILRPGELKVTVGKEGRYYKPGSLIKVQHERFKIGIGSGEIIEILRDGDLITGFRLMEKFDILSDRDYFIEYYVVDEERNHVVYPEPEIVGMPQTKQRTMKLQSVGEYTNVLMLSTPVPADSFYLPNFGDILSVIPGEPTGIAGKIYESKRYLVSDLSENPQGYDLALVQYNEEIYKTTSIDEIPDYKSSILSSTPKIYDNYERKPIDGEPGQGLPDSNSIKQVISNAIPRYRGAFSTPGNGNGEIGGHKMNTGDYIMYTGNTANAAGVTWTTARMYEWTGTHWVQLSIEANRWKYLDGINDLTSGALEGLFSTAFINTLVTKTAIIDQIFSKLIVLHDQGTIQSENYSQEGQLGFIIKANGDVEFNNGKFRGIIEALAGSFKNITGENLNIIGGRIQIGPLTVSDDQIGGLPDLTVSGSRTYAALFNELANWDRSVDTSVAFVEFSLYWGGSFNGQSINRIMFMYNGNTMYGFGIYNGITQIYRDQDIIYNSIRSRPLNHTVYINGGGSGSTLRITELPRSRPSEPGTLWVKADEDILRIRI
jgi:hypothetical protein